MDLLNNLRVFVRVVDSASFTAAADALDLSTAQVSRLVADLEEHVQARLLQRTTRRLSLTEAGERFLLRSRQILEEMEEATAEARGAHLKPSGRLRVHSMNGLGVLITPLIARYSELYPDVVFELTLSQRNPDPLEDGHDVVISIAHELADSQLVAHAIGQIYSVPCASPEYLQRRGVPDTPLALNDHQCLRMIDPLYSDQWVFQDKHGEHVISPAKTFQCNVAESMVKASEAGMGISLIPFYTATRPLSDGTLLRLLPAWRPRQRNVYALYPSRRFLDAKVRTWVAFLKAELPKLFAEHDAVMNDPRHWA
ncbi:MULTISPECIES: LysR family transcriptional regulator [unclassified Pseudomonas]|jgi:DNA-binding transcriptional LysR family regulator|uniref:LysR family transcriptional regulator n=1 Tax=unclassified Pseudomonas TaxID=196821 RepID=UPI0019126340|nr:LysR family transcriptional regulator [Pseudomonas sp. BF-R-26]MBK5312744.1 LysR family transcriptional regulator [Pseudomonas sp. TH71]MBK5371948.1 LysR family transcriptional regulator [Pseudomonas sp. TH40]MBK5383117.1 LysR family transcriptional regulator [Pseudomonas sp. TH35]MBK5388576.1 LysR family transcriptional regulator [Pseudomonas sp. TH38]MBK5405871.1 LysR family transcriptional regulator [Pseudomonas sp. TH37]MBK5467969.1 LysR family transcriptional regulator [Pseudomonas sp